ncbi:MAG: DUF2709 domain-containing protein [Parachlamydiaceae bacterium]
MAKLTVSKELQNSIKEFLNENPFAELLNAYLFYVEKRFDLNPVLFVRDKIIYQSTDDAVKALEKEGKLWHEAEIKISVGQASVNEQTKKIYICPFTGKVFGDNTHPNPQDAIYDWVSKCPENTERVGGLKAKRFFVSEDPEVIQNYLAKVKPKDPITKIVYSSVLNGKLFNSKAAVIDDFKKNYLKPMTLFEVQNQNKFEIESEFLNFIQTQLVEEKIGAFVEALAEEEAFQASIAKWLEA